MRYFLQISYKGNKYKGWQKQKNTTGCIQEIIEKAIEKATKVNDISILGCGRTDAGVHATKYFAKLDWKDDSLPKYIDTINYILPNDIVVYKIFRVNKYTHARFSANKRSYEYHMHFSLNPFKEELSAFYKISSIDEKAINAACSIILTKTNFYNFCKTPDRNKHTDCYIQDCRFVLSEDKQSAVVYISANRFLKSMVRVIVGDLLQIGQGKMTLQEFESLFDFPRKGHIHKIAHPQGLYLTDIIYNDGMLDIDSDEEE